MFALVGQLQVPPVPGGGPPPAHRGRSQPHPLPHEGVGPGCRACQEQVLVSVWSCFGRLHGAERARHSSRRVQHSGCCCCRRATATAVLQHTPAVQQNALQNDRIFVQHKAAVISTSPLSLGSGSCCLPLSLATQKQVLPEEAAPCEEGQRPDHRSQRGATANSSSKEQQQQQHAISGMPPVEAGVHFLQQQQQATVAAAMWWRWCAGAGCCLDC